MGRIPDKELTRLKQDISLQRVVESAGIALKRHGADWLGTCPFHNDKTPSLVISPKKNLWHCLGACQTGGSVIDWVMKIESVSFRHAVELLQNDTFSSLVAGSSAVVSSSSVTSSPLSPASVTATTTEGGAAAAPPPPSSKSPTIQPVKHSTVQKLPSSLSSNAEDEKLLQEVIDYYHRALKDSPEALAYLQKRGIGLAEAIDRFKLGYANRTLGYRLPFKNRKEGAAIRGQLQRIGILRASGHEHFNGSLVIPIINEAGQVTEVYGRKISDHLRKGTPNHCYLPGPHAGLWNEDALKASAEIILCESLIDALTFWCAGYRNVTTSYGIEGFTAEHLATFKKYWIKRVLIAYDRDDAGNRGAEKLAKQLLECGMDCYRLQFPKGMDANAYALQMLPASDSLGKVIRSAEWMGKGKAQAISVPDKIQTEITESTKPTEGMDKVKRGEGKGVPKMRLLETGQENSATKNNKEQEAETEIKTKTKTEKEVKEATGVKGKTETKSTLPASPQPETARQGMDAQINLMGELEELMIVLGDRRYRIRGLDKNLNHAQMKINLLVSRSIFKGVDAGTGAGADSGGGIGTGWDASTADAVHVDTLDCYQSRARNSFIKQAAIELGLKEEVIKHDLGKILLKLESVQTERLQSLQQPTTPTISLSDEEKQTALALLQSPALLSRIQADFKICGIVGEDSNTLTAYLACVSRKLDKPLAILIQSTSAA